MKNQKLPFTFRIIRITKILSVFIFISNLILISCTEESECEYAFGQVDAVNIDIDALREDFDDGLITEEEYQMELELLEFELTQIQENNPDCFYN